MKELTIKEMQNLSGGNPVDGCDITFEEKLKKALEAGLSVEGISDVDPEDRY